MSQAEHALKNTCVRLLHAYGEPFLQYIFTLDQQRVTTEVLIEQRRDVLEELHDVAVQPSFDNTFTVDVSHNALYHFLPSSDRQTPRAFELRAKAGGDFPDIISTDDDFLNEMFRHSYSQWPGVLLLCGWHISQHRIGVSRGFGNHDLRPLEEISRAFLADPQLSRMFPALNQEQLRRAPSIIHSYWALQPDTGMGPTYVGAVINQILLISAVRLAATQELWDFQDFWSQVIETVEDYRALARGDQAKFPVLVGIGGLPKTFNRVKFAGGHSVRCASGLDSHLLGYLGSGSHTVTLEIPTRATTFEWEPEQTTNSDAYDVVENELNLIRLAILLGSRSDDRPMTTRYFTRFLSPRSPASVELWSATTLEMSAAPYTEELEDEAIYQIVSEHKSLQLLLAHANHVEMPIRRLLQAAGNRNHSADTIVDAFIAIEALLSPGKEEKLTHKLSMAVANLLETNCDKRTAVYEEVMELYDLRSNIVHGNRNTPEQTFAQAQRTVSLAARVFHALCLPENKELLPMRASKRNKRLIASPPEDATERPATTDPIT